MELYDYLPPFLLGFLGGFHCVGMCGGIIASVSVSRGKLSWSGIALYQLARVTTYIFLGIAATTIGIIFLESASFANSQKLLSLVAGVAITFLALQVGGWIPERYGVLSKFLKIPPSVLRGLSKEGSAHYWLLLGFFNGLLPCGLVYAAMAIALEKADIFYSIVVMFLFGLGTVPWLFGIASVMKLIEPSVRNRFIKASAVAMVLYGLLLILKSTPLWNHSMMKM